MRNTGYKITLDKGTVCRDSAGQLCRVMLYRSFPRSSYLVELQDMRIFRRKPAELTVEENQEWHYTGR